MSESNYQAIKSWTKWAEIRRYSNLDRLAAGFRQSDAGSRALLNHELGPGEFRKTAAFGHEFIESSAFDHPSVLENQDSRRISNGRQPMGDDKGGAPLHHFVERSVDLGLGNRVERACRLIENQDRRILEQRAGDRQPLPLAARQHPPTLAGVGFESLFATLDELQRLGALRSDPQFLIRGVRLADPQIVGDRTVEQQGFLK